MPNPQHEVPPPPSVTEATVLRRVGNARLSVADVHRFVGELFLQDLHAKRVESLANGVVGVLHAAAMTVHLIGQGLAQAAGLKGKHAVKQVDRLLSNADINVQALFARWVPFLLAKRREIFVSMDWTDFDGDNHTTLAINLITSHGRATPLIWKTFRKSTLRRNRNQYEDGLLTTLREVVPENVRVTVLADRGFGHQKLYEFLRLLGFDFIVRFRQAIEVTDAKGRSKPAREWVPAGGQARMLRDAQVTKDRTSLPAVVVVHQVAMKEAWCLATSRADLSARLVVRWYGKRFTCEENFRDTKDPRFGLGLSATHVSKPARRDRMLFLSALSQALLTLLGAAAEAVGLDRTLKVNTVKKRTHSLFRQGLFFYGCIPTMKEVDLRRLMTSFEERVAEHENLSGVLACL